MDVNVVCTDDNYFFRLGISKVIEEALLSDAEVKFLSGHKLDRKEPKI